MQTLKLNVTLCRHLPLTQATLHFLRVNAQMCNLDLAKNGV